MRPTNVGMVCSAQSVLGLNPDGKWGSQSYGAAKAEASRAVSVQPPPVVVGSGGSEQLPIGLCTRRRYRFRVPKDRRGPKDRRASTDAGTDADARTCAGTNSDAGSRSWRRSRGRWWTRRSGWLNVGRRAARRRRYVSVAGTEEARHLDRRYRGGRYRRCGAGGYRRNRGDER